MENIVDIFLNVIQRFEQKNLPYMVVGSVAAMVYGEPRMTRDLDLVIDVLPSESENIESLFPLNEFYCPPIEVLRSELVHRGQFNLIHHQSGLKIDVIVRKKTEHSIEEFSRRQKIPFWKGVEVFLASPEDIIIKKLSYYREGGSEKHITDIRGILAETPIDHTYLQHWLNRLKLSDEWAKI